MSQRIPPIYFFTTSPLPPPGGRIGRGGFGGGLLGFPTVGAGKLASGPLFVLSTDEFWSNSNVRERTGTHLPFCYLHKLNSAGDAVLIGTHTTSVMDATARRVENNSKKFMPAHD